jgi:hypothetical protein
MILITHSWRHRGVRKVAGEINTVPANICMQKVYLSSVDVVYILDILSYIYINIYIHSYVKIESSLEHKRLDVPR